MRDIFEDIFANQPFDPEEAARRSLRPVRRKKFFAMASIGESGTAGYAVLLDGKPLRTPARHALAAPAQGIAAAIAAEWNALDDVIDPARMPMTRLANSIVDGVTGAEAAVAADIEKYLGTDLVFYRATEPDGLVARQREHWDPLLAFAYERLDARFVLAESVTHVAQPANALAAAARAIPRDPWRVGALHAVTTLTGSALIGLALAAAAVDVDTAWAAAHVDEDWNMTFWGRDEAAVQRRAFRFAEMCAAATVLDRMRETRG